MRPMLFAAAIALLAAPLPAAAQDTVARDDLRLRDVLSLVFDRNPALRAGSLGVRAHDAAAEQAGAWPNPELSFDLENAAGGGEFHGVDGAEATLALSQLVELGGKRGHRRAESALERDAARHTRDALQLDVARDATHAFIAVLAAQEQLALTSGLVELAESTRVAVDAQVRAGAALGVESRRARVAAETSRIEADLAARALESARRRLASLWGDADADGFGRAVGSLESIDEELPSLDTLLGDVEHTPDVMRWESEAARLRAQANLERAARVPDLNLSAGVRRLNEADETVFVFGVSTPLALFDRRTQAARAAELRADQAAGYGRSTDLELRGDVAAASESAASARLEATRLRDTVLPEARAAAAESADAYRAGRMALTDVLDAQRTFHQLKSRYVGALARYHEAVADMERLTGTSLSTLEDIR